MKVCEDQVHFWEWCAEHGWHGPFDSTRDLPGCARRASRSVDETQSEPPQGGAKFPRETA